MIFFSPNIPDEAWEWRNKDQIWKWCRQYTGISSGQQRQWLEKIDSDPTIKMFGIYTTDLTPVGACGFTSIDKHNQRAEFSLYIAPEYQRKGFATMALSVLLRHGFENMNFIRIWGEVFDGNPAMKIFKKLGMQEEGRLRQSYFRNGKFIDSIIVSILRSEWDDSSSIAIDLFNEPSVSSSDYYDARENIARARPLHR